MLSHWELAHQPHSRYPCSLGAWQGPATTSMPQEQRSASASLPWSPVTDLLLLPQPVARSSEMLRGSKPALKPLHTHCKHAVCSERCQALPLGKGQGRKHVTGGVRVTSQGPSEQPGQGGTEPCRLLASSPLHGCLPWRLCLMDLVRPHLFSYWSNSMESAHLHYTCKGS